MALLDANIFGFIDYAATPHLAERRASMPGIALTAGHDVIAVQELWLDEDVSLWRTAAAEHGYLMFVGERGGFNTGLATFVREEIVQGGSMRTFAEKSFAHVDASEFFPGPGIKRGYQHTGFVHRDIGPVRIFNAHLWPYPANWKGRMWQVRELGIATRTESAADEVILVAGDMNAGPYYKSATWRTPDGGEETSWFHNTISYPLLLVYGELVDLAVMGRPATDAASDVTLGNTVVNDPEQATSIPGAEDGWCTRTPQSTFTGTDCNALYFEQYAGTEYPARLDHILAHDPDGRIVVQNSSLAFTEPRRFGGLTIEPSDHYGVAVELLLSSP